VQIITPHALIMPFETEINRCYGDEITFPAEVTSWFRGASAYWWQYS